MKDRTTNQPTECATFAKDTDFANLEPVIHPHVRDAFEIITKAFKNSIQAICVREQTKKLRQQQDEEAVKDMQLQQQQIADEKKQAEELQLQQQNKKQDQNGNNSNDGSEDDQNSNENNNNSNNSNDGSEDENSNDGSEDHDIDITTKKKKKSVGYFSDGCLFKNIAKCIITFIFGTFCRHFTISLQGF